MGQTIDKPQELESKNVDDMEKKIEIRQKYIAEMAKRLSGLEEVQKGKFVSSNWDEIHRLRLKIEEEQIYLRADIDSKLRRVDNVTNESGEPIGNQAALVKDVEEENKIFEKLAKLELDVQSHRSLIDQHEENAIKQRADLKSIKEETSGIKASIEGLHLKLQSYLDKQEESQKLSDSFKAQMAHFEAFSHEIKEKDKD